MLILTILNFSQPIMKKKNLTTKFSGIPIGAPVRNGKNDSQVAYKANIIKKKKTTPLGTLSLGLFWVFSKGFEPHKTPKTTMYNKL